METADSPLKAFLRQFRGRNHGALVQFIKYAIAGGMATIVHVAVFYSLALKFIPALTPNDPISRLVTIPPHGLTDAARGWNAALDNFIAFMISNTVVYLINTVWVFESGRYSRRKEVSLFFAVSGFSVFIGTGLQTFLIGKIGLDTSYAFFINAGVCLLINYAVRKFFIFKR